MFNRVHVDEKWFYITRDKLRFYVWHDEELPPRTLQSKTHIAKVMFLVAVARPRDGWDGKIGCWPLVEHVVAQRSSKNRPSGTPILAPQTINRSLHREILCDKVFPAIQDKWVPAPGFDDSTIIVQQDNARPHVLPGSASRASWSSWKLDDKVDLGFFNAIQSLQHQQRCQDLPELICAVQSAFNELSPNTLTKTFMTLQRVMNACIEVSGDSSFKIPRSKDKDCLHDVLDAMDTRLEEEQRHEEICALLEGVTTNELDSREIAELEENLESVSI
ncbi:hypothetical protein AeMF1_005797 [Aphanomyces euteiches]|nr:hypothetical protein AeMF1_005797 [Aphanomyces euteiches]KAH9167731.1 hypothetical protein AeNC1_018096 [Aphanomyces euteiches]